MTYLRSGLLAVSIATVSALAGCGTNSMPVAKSPITGNAFQGRAFGGQQPIVGATIRLYAASSNGYGKPSTYPVGTSLLGSNLVQTGAGGSFNITGDYTCPSYGTEVYLTATGGNPGLAQGTTNANIAIMAALGPCGALNANTDIIINELTTVASVWALSPFMSGISAVGTSAGNSTGLTNAFATVNKLVNIGTGSLPGSALPPGATLPTQKMNLLADILASCINTAGGVATDTSTPCGALFSAATVNGVAPTDTITAALNLAQNPNLATSLSASVTPTAPFQPIPDPLPGDFGLVITYSGGALAAPSAIAADGAGNLWVPNAGNNSVSKLDALGTSATDSTGFLSGSSGFTTGPLKGPTAVAIDQSGYAWLTNGGNNTVARISADGSTSTVFQGGGLSGPSSVAIDAGGNAWVTNRTGAGVTLIGTSGSLSSFSNGGIVAPVAIAINPK
jgi:hypothetical protein